MIWPARKSVIALLILVIIGTWWIASTRYSDRLIMADERMETVEKENNYLEKQLAGYRNKFPDQTADEIAERIVRLENFSKSRNLTPEQNSKLEKLVRKSCHKIGEIFIWVNAVDSEAMSYANDFEDVFLKAGCKTIRENRFGLTLKRNIGGEKRGLYVIPRINSDPGVKSKAKEFTKILSNAGLTFDTDEKLLNGFPHEAKYFAFFIGGKPEITYVKGMITQN